MTRTRGEEGGGRQGKGKRGEQETVETVERENDEEGKALTQYSNLIMRLQDSIGQHTIKVYSTLFQD